MLINSLKISNDNIYLKNHSFESKPSQTIPIEKNAISYTPRANELCSKFNINFAPRLDEDKKLDEFCLRLENKIKEMTTPKDPEIASWVMTPDYLDLINETFKKDNIGYIYKTGISANAMLNYLSKKQQLQLKGEHLAFVVDEMSLDYLKGKDIDSFLSKENTRNVKFYCLDTNEKETEKLIEEFNKLTNNSFEVTRIKRPENSNFSKTIDAKKIKAIIKGFASAKFKTKEQQSQFIDVITRYIDNNFLVFSYATLCEKLKEHYKLIEQEVKAQGKTMDDVVYLIPESGKSYDLVSYLYAKTNNIPQNQFENYLCFNPNLKRDKIFVVLDDLAASGLSGCMNTNIAFVYPHNNLLIAPVIACKKGIEKINETIKSTNSKNVKLICSNEYNDLGYIFDKLADKEDFIFKKEHEGNIRKYMNQYKDFDLRDVKFLFKYFKSGCGCTHTFINFPYMIPDNSSELNKFFGGYFLNNDDASANKATQVFRRQEAEYGKIKEDIENYYSNNP